VEDIAADNIAAIRQIQPRGPYFLSGACYGGRVAYEMARQLEAAGEVIGLLLMLDPSSPFHRADGRLRGERDGAKPPTPRTTAVRFVVDRIAMHASAFARLHGAQRAAFVREKMRTLRDIMRQRDLFRGDRSEYHQRLVYAANRAAGSRYVPGPFGGAAVVCLTRDRPVRGERNYRLDWLELVPQCGTPRYVAGEDSGAMLNLPHVYELASLVNRWLEAAHARSPTQAADSAR
jgi:thioesterase domain-containing protein